jgi:carboxymethylenebutenolidase
MRRIFFAIALLVLSSCAAPQHADEHASHAAPAAAPAAVVLHGSTVTFPSVPGEGRGYLSLPAAGGKQPGLVVIHEWWGLTDWVKQQADRFADHGYVVVAVDLYRGKVTNDPAVAHELSRGLPDDRALADMKSAYAYLASRPDVDPARIGSIGWCMGGGESLSLAIAEPRVAACVINYGHLVTDPATIASIHPPILGNFGALDKGITPDDVNAFKAALDAAHKQNDIKIYPNADHGFMNWTNTEGFSKAAAEDAQARVDRFFASTLKP